MELQGNFIEDANFDAKNESFFRLGIAMVLHFVLIAVIRILQREGRAVLDIECIQIAMFSPCQPSLATTAIIVTLDLFFWLRSYSPVVILKNTFLGFFWIRKVINTYSQKLKLLMKINIFDFTKTIPFIINCFNGFHKQYYYRR